MNKTQYPGRAALGSELGAGGLALCGIEEAHGGDLGGLLVRLLLQAREEGIPRLFVKMTLTKSDTRGGDEEEEEGVLVLACLVAGCSALGEHVGHHAV